MKWLKKLWNYLWGIPTKKSPPKPIPKPRKRGKKQQKKKT